MLRVNSPGGSATASDTIWREVVRVRAAGKPVVVSMGDVAASGGYFIAMAADVIVAQPGTMTGSIGVISGKPVFERALDRAGVITDSVAWAPGPHARPLHPFTEDEWDRINAWLDAIYADFTAKAAEGRRMPAERMHEARPRPGLDRGRRGANGLVDELGGHASAAEIARSRPACRPTRRCAATPGSPRSTSSARRSRASRGPAAALDLGFAGGLSWGPAWRLAAQRRRPPYGR